MTPLVSPSFLDLVGAYTNTEAHNDLVYRQLADLTWADPGLYEHRRHIETNKLGFGDAAFHAMWLRLLCHACSRFDTIRALEIGVFKGQVISLWAMIAKRFKIDIQITAITPLSGQPLPRSRISTWLRSRLDSRFQEQLRNANFYALADYRAIITELFNRFDTSFSSVLLYHGYSTDQRVLKSTEKATYHIVYVDGDHTYHGSLHDFQNFGRKVIKGGWLVADDAGCSLPGTAFWKGHEAVSRAAEVLPKLGFKNILNVGHNRIYERME